MPIIGEEWRNVVGLEGLFEVSNKGRVRSVSRFVERSRGKPFWLEGRIRKPLVHQNRAYLCYRGKNRAVHHLVLEAFVGPKPDGMECCHFPDRNPLNNCLENLRWDTSKANSDDMRIHGTHRIKNPTRGEDNFLAKKTNAEVLEIRRLHSIGYRQVNLASMFNTSQASISLIVLRKQWKHL